MLPGWHSYHGTQYTSAIRRRFFLHGRARSVHASKGSKGNLNTIPNRSPAVRSNLITPKGCYSRDIAIASRNTEEDTEVPNSIVLHRVSDSDILM
jgi:hypothetical protein